MKAGLLAGARLLDPPPSPMERYYRAPGAWIQDRLREHPWKLQRRVANSVVRCRYTAVPSCHGAGKSWLASRLAAWWIDIHPVGEAFVVTTAPTTHQVETILWREIERAHRRGGLAGRITSGSVPQWKIGNEIVAYGRKPADYNPDAFQGIHARYILVIIDEANGVPRVLWDAVDSLATNASARVLAIGNPDNPGSHFKTVCDPGSGWNIVRISAFDTPNFTGEDIPSDLGELLVDVDWVEERKKRWGVGSPLWTSKVLGRFPNIASDNLIAPDWIEAAQNRYHETDDRKILGQLGCDIARFGDDESVIIRQREIKCVRLWTGSHFDTMTTAGHIARQMRYLEEIVPAVVDEVGVGAGVVDRLKELDLPVYGFNGGTSAIEKNNFVNARSEAFWRLRERFETDMIAIDPRDDILAGQLVGLKWYVDSSGRIGAERKEDYRKRLRAASPDRADALMMSYVPGPLISSEVEKLMRSHIDGGKTIPRNIMTRRF